ncbi:4Fe-4S dicluster domain-containing protein [Budviciaceae bacterium BWR-B9]|uniref:4Fe-4S dicluster domain-containing protein n=1 Tax=Limnobaculum allomyrinae TaxID=2791986 RepID=A0ABS1IVM7_9GAMM|nr:MULTISPECIES: 4Fe-4S dicluster domain-containing protein [Limnobaculum]MBK5145811.1 4Fe-4S dicluster domain-containing protein [Limnobaculum allomyrinae]MBV7693910.1 4Fe-4S dicluster domain-containing protein [Limnobaculum sp. M2-1]
MNRFVIAEPKDCIGCNTCMAACSEVHKAAGLQSHPRLIVMRDASSTAPILCRHCEDAPCARVCPVKAITHQNNAIMLNESLCIGCKLCAIACPFGAITPDGSKPLSAPVSYDRFSQADAHAREARTAPYNQGLHPMLSWAPGLRQVAVKCDLCAFLPQGPECVRVCPIKTLFLVDENAIEQANAAKRLEAMEVFHTDNAFGYTPSDQQRAGKE